MEVAEERRGHVGELWPVEHESFWMRCKGLIGAEAGSPAKSELH